MHKGMQRKYIDKSSAMVVFPLKLGEEGKLGFGFHSLSCDMLNSESVKFIQIFLNSHFLFLNLVYVC